MEKGVPILGVSPHPPRLTGTPSLAFRCHRPVGRGIVRPGEGSGKAGPTAIRAVDRAQAGMPVPQRQERRELSQAGEGWGKPGGAAGRESPERGAGARRGHSPGKSDTGGPELRPSEERKGVTTQRPSTASARGL